MKTLGSVRTLAVLMGLALASSGLMAAEMDLDGLPAGTIVFELEEGNGISGSLNGKIYVLAFNPVFGLGINAAVVFDTSDPSGGDDDLGTPNMDFGGPGVGIGGEAGSPFQNDTALGHVMIIAENLDDGNGDGLVDDPDDADLAGSFIEFDFTDVKGKGVTVNSLTYLDVEREQGEDGAFIELQGSGIPTQLIAMPPTGDNGMHKLDGIGVSGVEMMRITLNGSGAIESVIFEEEVERPCWVTTGGFQNAGVPSGPKDCTFGGNIGPPSSGAWEAIDHNTGDNFHTNDIWITFCEDTDTTGPQQPGGKKGFEVDRANFECTGRLNGDFGYDCSGYLVDGGEPAGKKGNDPDYFFIEVTDGGGDVVFTCDGELDGGNVQLHPPVGKP